MSAVTTWKYTVNIPLWIIGKDAEGESVALYRVNVLLQPSEAPELALSRPPFFVLRRFSQFRQLHLELKTQFPELMKQRGMAPPAKHSFLSGNNKELLDRRREELQRWLWALISKPEVARSAILKTFLDFDKALQRAQQQRMAAASSPTAGGPSMSMLQPPGAAARSGGSGGDYSGPPSEGGDFDDARSEVSNFSYAPSLAPTLMESASLMMVGSAPPAGVGAAGPASSEAAMGAMRLGLKLDQRADVRRLMEVLQRRVGQAATDLQAAIAEIERLAATNGQLEGQVRMLHGQLSGAKSGREELLEQQLIEEQQQRQLLLQQLRDEQVLRNELQAAQQQLAAAEAAHSSETQTLNERAAAAEAAAATADAAAAAATARLLDLETRSAGRVSTLTRQVVELQEQLEGAHATASQLISGGVSRQNSSGAAMAIQSQVDDLERKLQQSTAAQQLLSAELEAARASLGLQQGQQAQHAQEMAAYRDKARADQLLLAREIKKLRADVAGLTKHGAQLEQQLAAGAAELQQYKARCEQYEQHQQIQQQEVPATEAPVVLTVPISVVAGPPVDDAVLKELPLLREQTERHAQLVTQLQREAQQMAALQQELETVRDAARADAAATAAQLAELRAQNHGLAEAAAQANGHADAVAGLQQQLEAARAAADAAKAQGAAVAADLAQQLDAARAAAAAAQLDGSTAAADASRQLEAARAAAAAAQADSAATVADLSRQLDAARAAAVAAQAEAAATVADLSGQLETARAAAATAQAEAVAAAADLVAAHQQMQVLSGQLSAAQEDAATSREELEAVRADMSAVLHDTLEPMHEQVETLQAAAAAGAQQLADAEAELEAARAQLESVRAELDAARSEAAAAAAAAVASSELEAAARNKAAGVQQLADAQAELEAARAQLESVRADLSRQLEAAHQQVQVLSGQLSAAQDDAATSREELEAARADMSAVLQDTLGPMHEQVETLQAAAAAGAQQLADAEAELEAARAQLESVRAALDAARSEVAAAAAAAASDREAAARNEAAAAVAGAVAASNCEAAGEREAAAPAVQSELQGELRASTAETNAAPSAQSASPTRSTSVTESTTAAQGAPTADALAASEQRAAALQAELATALQRVDAQAQLLQQAADAQVLLQQRMGELVAAHATASAVNEASQAELTRLAAELGEAAKGVRHSTDAAAPRVAHLEQVLADKEAQLQALQQEQRDAQEAQAAILLNSQQQQQQQQLGQLRQQLSELESRFAATCNQLSAAQQGATEAQQLRAAVLRLCQAATAAGSGDSDQAAPDSAGDESGAAAAAADSQSAVELLAAVLQRLHANNRVLASAVHLARTQATDMHRDAAVLQQQLAALQQPDPSVDAVTQQVRSASRSAEGVSLLATQLQTGLQQLLLDSHDVAASTAATAALNGGLPNASDVGDVSDTEDDVESLRRQMSQANKYGPAFELDITALRAAVTAHAASKQGSGVMGSDYDADGAEPGSVAELRALRTELEEERQLLVVLREDNKRLTARLEELTQQAAAALNATVASDAAANGGSGVVLGATADAGQPEAAAAALATGSSSSKDMDALQFENELLRGDLERLQASDARAADLEVRLAAALADVQRLQAQLQSAVAPPAAALPPALDEGVLCQMVSEVVGTFHELQQCDVEAMQREEMAQAGSDAARRLSEAGADRFLQHYSQSNDRLELVLGQTRSVLRQPSLISESPETAAREVQLRGVFADILAELAAKYKQVNELTCDRLLAQAVAAPQPQPQQQQQLLQQPQFMQHLAAGAAGMPAAADVAAGVRNVLSKFRGVTGGPAVPAVPANPHSTASRSSSMPSSPGGQAPASQAGNPAPQRHSSMTRAHVPSQQSLAQTTPAGSGGIRTTAANPNVLGGLGARMTEAMSMFGGGGGRPSAMPGRSMSSSSQQQQQQQHRQSASAQHPHDLL